METKNGKGYNQNMRVIFIFYHVEYDEDLMDILKKTGIKCYSKIERVLGKGKGSEPRLDTAVWPGFNNVLIVGIEAVSYTHLTLPTKRIV